VSFSQKVADAICARLAAGESLRAICRAKGMPAESTVRLWARDNVAGFSAQYTRARDIGLDVLAEEILEIADTPELGSTTRVSADGEVEITEGDMLQHRKLKIDARKWFLSKLAPKRYGDRQLVEHAGSLSLVGLVEQSIAPKTDEPSGD